MKLKMVAPAATLALVLAALALGRVSTTEAAPKPGFTPGVWIGAGTISGSVTDGPVGMVFRGSIGFTLRVDRNLRASGSGTWKLEGYGSEDADWDDAVDAVLRSRASLRLFGSATDVQYAGKEYLVGDVIASGVHQRIKGSPEKPRSGRLTIKRAGKCRVTGVAQIQPGMTLTWSAKLRGSDTCNA